MAERLHAPRRAVLHAIRTGKLQGVRGLGRSVWLVTEDARARFIASRQTVAPLPTKALREIGMADG